jgi:hypothetical protein
MVLVAFDSCTLCGDWIFEKNCFSSGDLMRLLAGPGAGHTG